MTTSRFRRWGAVAGAAAWAVQAVVATAQAAPLTVEDWRSDIAFARAEMPKRHANLFHSISRIDYEAALDRLLADLDAVDEHEVVMRLAEIVASVGDGHTRLTLPLDAQAGGFNGHTPTGAWRVRSFHQLPLRLARVEEGYLVEAVDDSHAGLLGAHLIAIDGHGVDAVEAALTPVIHRDNEYQLRGLMPRFMVVPEVLHARGVSPSTGTSTWRFEDASGRPVSASLTPVAPGSATHWVELPAPAWPAVRHPAGRGPLWFSDIEHPGAVYARIAEIADQPDLTFAKFADELEEHLATTGRRRLIVDLRGNPGGDNSLNAPLLRALIRTDWVSAPGALQVLVDAGTFSAAMNLAQDLERWLPAVFVGAATGARPNSYGDARKLVLPRSGLTLRLSSLYWQNHPRDGRAAIEALIAARPTAQDLRSGHDPAEAALAALDEPAQGLAGNWRGRISAEFRHATMDLQLADGAEGVTGSLSIPDFDVTSAPVEAPQPTGPEWRGTVALGGRPAAIAGRIAGRHMVGWIDYRGTRYPFAALMTAPGQALADTPTAP